MTGPSADAGDHGRAGEHDGAGGRREGRSAGGGASTSGTSLDGERAAAMREPDSCVR